MTTAKGMARAKTKRFGHSPPWESTLTEKDIALARTFAPDLIDAGYRAGDTMRSDAIMMLYEHAERDLAAREKTAELADQEAAKQKVAAQKRKAAHRYKKSSTAQWREWLEPVAERFPSLTADELASAFAQVEDDYAESLERRKGDATGMVLDAVVGLRFSLLSAREERLKLEQRVATLEASTLNLADAYQGSWMSGKSYARGQLVNHDGSFWLALCGTERKPGTTDLRLAASRESRTRRK